MNDTGRNYGATTVRTDGRAIDQGLRQYMLGVYNYMAMAVAGTGLVSLASPRTRRWFKRSPRPR